MTADHQTDKKHVKIKYRPREQFRSFHNRKQRWSVLVCHRRAGKTVATLNDLIRGAVNECKPEGRYAFIFPQRDCHAVAIIRLANAKQQLNNKLSKSAASLPPFSALTSSRSGLTLFYFDVSFIQLSVPID
jgi:hypothetical protein